MTKTERKACITARNKMAKYKHRCDDTCPGWAVFTTNDAGDDAVPGTDESLEIMACDACWDGAPKHLRLLDDEAAALPEAQNELFRDCRDEGLPLSIWMKSLGYERVPRMTQHEAAELFARLEEGRLNVEAAEARAARPS